MTVNISIGLSSYSLVLQLKNKFGQTGVCRSTEFHYFRWWRTPGPGTADIIMLLSSSTYRHSSGYLGALAITPTPFTLSRQVHSLICWTFLLIFIVILLLHWFTLSSWTAARLWPLWPFRSKLTSHRTLIHHRPFIMSAEPDHTHDKKRVNLQYVAFAPISLKRWTGLTRTPGMPPVLRRKWSGRPI